jgi:hypothetical protein
MPKPKPGKVPPDVDALVAAAKAVLDQDGAIARSKAGPPSVRDRVVDALRVEGFEVTARVVRIPIEAQLVAVLRDGSYLAFNTIASHIRGATAAEAKQVAKALAETGRARRILRTATETLVPAAADVVANKGLAIAAKRVSDLARQLQSAARKGMGVLRSDVEQALDGVLPTNPRSTAPRRPDSSLELEVVLRAVDDARDAKVGLSFVPKVVGLLSVNFGQATAQKALLEAASRGFVELRPEGGLGRLSEAERMACPEGPQGTRLSWARRIEAQG